MALLYPTSTNALQKTLGAQLDQGVTASMTLNNTTSIQNKPGVCVIDRIDTDGNLKSTSVREYVQYTGTSGSTLTGLTRNVDNSSSDQDHAVGAVVEFIPDVTWAQAIMDTLDGTSTDAILNTPAITTPKITTSINDSNGNEIIKTPATASAVNEVTVSNAATTDNPIISATGGDSNIGLTLKPKGTGVIAIDGPENYAADAGSNDTYAITVEGITAYSTGQIFRFKANTINTGAATLNVNSLGAKTIVKNYNVTLADGDVKANQLVEVIYDGTNMQLLSPISNAASGLSSKVLVITRDLTVASGNVAYTGAGFVPTALIGIGVVSGSAFPISWGIADSALGKSTISRFEDSNFYVNVGGSYFQQFTTGAGASQYATVNSFDADGFTLAWTKTGSPTGTATIIVLCLK